MGSLEKGSDPMPMEITEEGCKTPAESLIEMELLIRQVAAQTSKTLKVINQESQIWLNCEVEERGRETNMFK